MRKSLFVFICILLVTAFCGCDEANNGCDNQDEVTLTGPISVTDDSGPFHGTNSQPVGGPGLPPPELEPYGYIEEEYFISGTVNGEPYSTSMLVRKPKDPSKFSGLVAVETIHAQGAIPLWGFQNVWMSGGHAWVAVASQPIALNSMVKPYDPERYETLNIPTGDSGGCAAMMDGTADAVSNEIMAQAGKLLKSNLSQGPFQGMTVEKMIMGGASQTGSTTTSFILNQHDQARMPDGQPIYDGYLPMMMPTSEKLSAKDAVIMQIFNEGDLMFGPMRLEPMTPVDTEGFRQYQIAGGSHVCTRGISDPGEIFGTLEGIMQEGEQLSQYPGTEIFSALLVNMIDWVLKGTPPPSADGPIEIADGQIVRDEIGNAKGGLRSPYVDLPTAHITASSPWAPGAGLMANAMRPMIGTQEPISQEKFLELYGSKENYLNMFNAQIDQMVADRWLLAEDGANLKAQEAARNDGPLQGL